MAVGTPSASSRPGAEFPAAAHSSGLLARASATISNPQHLLGAKGVALPNLGSDRAQLEALGLLGKAPLLLLGEGLGGWRQS